MFNEDNLTADQKRIFKGRLDAASSAVARGDLDAALDHLNDIFQVHPELDMVVGEALAQQ